MRTQLEKDQFLLSLLAQERGRFTQADDDLVKVLIDLLVARGVYPEPQTKHTVYQMVDGWGAYWHRWSGPFNCPQCNYDLRNRVLGPPFKLEIAITSNYLDRTIAHQCPHCNHKWNRK